MMGLQSFETAGQCLWGVSLLKCMKPDRPELGLPQFPLNERVSEGAHMAHTHKHELLLECQGTGDRNSESRLQMHKNVECIKQQLQLADISLSSSQMGWQSKHNYGPSQDIWFTPKFCHHLRTLMSSQTCMVFFLPWNPWIYTSIAPIQRSATWLVSPWLSAICYSFHMWAEHLHWIPHNLSA